MSYEHSLAGRAQDPPVQHVPWAYGMCGQTNTQPVRGDRNTSIILAQLGL